MQREQPEDQDAAWKAIIDNYGERPVLDDDAAAAEPTPAPAAPDLYDAEPEPLPVEPDDEFVPPAPPPIPKPTPDRLLAWLGVFGAPALLLFFVVTGIAIPRLVGWTLVGSFIAGFCYLVIRMPSSPRDPWDDGSRL